MQLWKAGGSSVYLFDIRGIEFPGSLPGMTFWAFDTNAWVKSLMAYQPFLVPMKNNVQSSDP
jgi:hypothetical protein